MSCCPGNPMVAAKVNFMSPQIVEMAGMMGYDCLWICHEHLYSEEAFGKVGFTFRGA